MKLTQNKLQYRQQKLYKKKEEPMSAKNRALTTKFTNIITNWQKK